MSEYCSTLDGHLGRISVTNYRVQLSKATSPIHSHPFRAGLRQRKLERNEVGKKLKDNVAEVATSEWASSIVFAIKMNGSLPFCDEYRKLDAVIVRPS